MKLDILNTKGHKADSFELDEQLFGSPVSLASLTQYLRTALFNKRQGTSKAKRRGEVSGSGKKPWAQKGTGRARVGDKRTPIWRHGGIIHGPKPKDWSLGLNSKNKEAALLGSLTLKINEGKLFVLENLEHLKGKTKEAADMLATLKLNRNVLMIADKWEAKAKQSVKNISHVTSADTSRLNPLQVLSSDVVLVTVKALENIQKRLGGSK